MREKSLYKHCVFLDICMRTNKDAVSTVKAYQTRLGKVQKSLKWTETMMIH